VQLVATAHGNELQNLVKNPALSDLIGGIQSVTLGEAPRCMLDREGVGTSYDDVVCCAATAPAQTSCTVRLYWRHPGCYFG
jgi:stage III sporulation protein SpoIIIAA